MVLYRILLGVDALVALIFAWFFLEGLGDGTVSSGNALLWFATLGGLAAILAGGIALRRAGHVAAAILVLLLPAMPALLYAAFIVVFMASGARWQ